MSRIKKQILSKLKEYGSKMGTNTMGGDDYTSKKKGGLRDFDGYDNVDYNKDMPMDEATRGTIHKAAKKGSYPVTLVVVKDGKVIKQVLNIKTPAEVPAAFNVVKNYHKHKGATVHIEDRTGKRLFSESVNEAITPPNSKKVEALKKAVQKINRKYKVQVSKIGPTKGEVEIELGSGNHPDNDYNTIDKLVKKLGIKHYSVFNEGIVNEACWDTYKQVGMKTKGGKQVPNCVPESISEGMFSVIDQIKKDSKDIRDFLKNVFKDREFKKMSNDKEFIKYLKSIYEGIEENFPSNWLQGRVSDYHTSLRGKKKDYSGGTNFKKKNHGQPDIEEDDEDQETNQLSNKQTHIKSKLKVSESGKDKSEKNYKDWKNTNEGFDKIEHLKLLNKAMRAMPGSPKQKDIIRKLNVVRKAGGMRPLTERTKTDSNSKGYKEATKLIAKLRSTTFKKMNDDELEQFRAALAFSFDLKEYASKLTLSYMLDKDSKLDGTPEDIKAIDEKAKRDYKDEYKKFQSSTKAKKYRAELNKYNRDKGTYGNGDGKDASHKGGKIVGFESEKKNRGRAEKSRLKKND